jgi:amino-acid N-acetyltransferase
MTVRAATTAELADLGRLLAEAGLPTVADDVWAAWVADDSGDLVVGGVALERHGSPGRRQYLLRSLVVAPSERGSGLGAELVRTALAAADADQGGRAGVSLLTETADGYFPRFGFAQVDRSDLPAELSGSPELTGACSETARAFRRR